MELHVALIGSGSIARAQAMIFRSLPHVRVVAVSGRGGEGGRKLAADLNATYFTDLDAMLAEDVQAVSVCTPHVDHCAATLAAARAGKHVLVEKPMACTVDECDRMIAACREAGVKLMVGQTFRFRSDTAAVRRLIDDGWLGEPAMAVDVTAYGQMELPSWYFDSRVARGGILMSSASHRIYRLHHLFGSPIVEVHARAGAFGHSIDTEDSAVLSLRFANGALGTIVQSCLDFPRPSEMTLQVQGKRGAIALAGDGKIRGWGVNGTIERTIETDHGLRDELIEFVSAIDQSRAPAVTGADGRSVVAVLEAAYHSVQSGRPEAVTS